MAHSIYQNDQQYRSWELFIQDRHRNLSIPTIASGTYQLLDLEGNEVVPLSSAIVTSPNKVSFLIRPSSGSATIGEYSEIWSVFIGSEIFTREETLYVKERF